MSWGYNAIVVTLNSVTSTASIQGHARGLLADINHYRRTRVSYGTYLQGWWSANYGQQAEEQKLIFVAHDIGGIIVQAVSSRCSRYFDVELIANLNSALGESLMGTDNLYRNVTGIIFLGTPHRGLKTARQAAIIVRILFEYDFAIPAALSPSRASNESTR